MIINIHSCVCFFYIYIYIYIYIYTTIYLLLVHDLTCISNIVGPFV